MKLIQVYFTEDRVLCDYELLSRREDGHDSELLQLINPKHEQAPKKLTVKEFKRSQSKCIGEDEDFKAYDLLVREDDV